MDLNGALAAGSGGPPVAGGVDLSGIKNGPTPEQKAGLRREMLTKLGLLCPCGKEMGQTSYVVYSIRDDMVPGPTGPQPAMTCGTIVVHDIHCPVVRALGDEAVAIRRQPRQEPLTWLGDDD